MAGNLRCDFWIRFALAVGSAALSLVTMAWHDWIEVVLRIDPDRGNGWLEWLIVAVALGLSVASSMSAGREWRRSLTRGAVAVQAPDLGV